MGAVVQRGVSQKLGKGGSPALSPVKLHSVAKARCDFGGFLVMGLALVPMAMI